VLASGMPFPLQYEVVSIENVQGGAAVLDTAFGELQALKDVILLERRNNDALGAHLHYVQRVNRNGRPSHVSANYLFVRGPHFFHVSAANFAPGALGRERWGAPQPDATAEDSVQLLLKSTRFR
jgi:hypothetical protein